MPKFERTTESLLPFEVKAAIGTLLITLLIIFLVATASRSNEGSEVFKFISSKYPQFANVKSEEELQAILTSNDFWTSILPSNNVCAQLMLAQQNSEFFADTQEYSLDSFYSRVLFNRYESYPAESFLYNKTKAYPFTRLTGPVSGAYASSTQTDDYMQAVVRNTSFISGYTTYKMVFPNYVNLDSEVMLYYLSGGINAKILTVNRDTDVQLHINCNINTHLDSAGPYVQVNSWIDSNGEIIDYSENIIDGQENIVPAIFQLLAQNPQS